MKNNYRIYEAPARINLIGEHIDYNGGMVLPAAISLRTRCKFIKREDSKIILNSENTNFLVERLYTLSPFALVAQPVNE